MESAPDILLVDDDPESASFVANLLKEASLLSTAESKRAAMDKIRKKKPKLVILNTMMQHNEGISLYRTLKKSAEYRDLPVIMLSTLDEETFVKCHGLYGYHGHGASSDRFIKFPLEADELRRAVAEIMP